MADLERQSDATARGIERTLIHDAANAPQPAVLLDVATALRYANESLARCSVIARDYVFAATAGDK